MLDRASQILDCLMDAPVITVEPGFVVESRTAYGVHGDKDDLALSVEWRDADGCSWAADFSEAALSLAEVWKATVSMHDFEGTKVLFRLYKPVGRVKSLLNRKK